MSESDDTDILLLIPPNYFITAAEQKMQYENSYGRMNGGASTPPPPPPPAPATQAATSAAYRYLSANRKAKLNDINSRLNDIELDEQMHQQRERFSAPSDISSISNSTTRTQFGCNKVRRDSSGLIHSTPKNFPLRREHTTGDMKVLPEDGVLREIDTFLADRQWNYRTNDYCLRHHMNEHGTSPAAHIMSLPETLDRIERSRSPIAFGNTPKKGTTHSPAQSPAPSPTRSPNDSNLLNLSEIWGRSGQATAIACGSNSAVKEEQLRRQHLEKTIRLMQVRLLEYQQRLSVAIEVDRSKNAALSKTQFEYRRVRTELQSLLEAKAKLETTEQSLNIKLDALRKELTQSISLCSKYQEENEKLKTNLDACSRQSIVSGNNCKQQIEDLERKINLCKRSEDSAINDLNKIKDGLLKAEHQCDKLKLQCNEMDKEINTLRHQKETLHELHKKQKSRSDLLETQKKMLQESLDNFTEVEINLKKKLEMQQKTLKLHYQQQLENVVAKKVKEFQGALDKAEETLKSEARDREHLIADRAVKQLELINEKSELELNLMQEKHNEEVSLYRIQLANASKKIEDLEANLNNYKTKRVAIAERLHDVMETQWQKALEILTSPHQEKQPESETEPTSPDTNETQYNKVNVNYETPKTSKIKKVNSKENNLNLVSAKLPKLSSISNQPPTLPMDRLQAYIELLLSKSPSDFDKLDEVLALSNKQKSSASKLDKATKRIKPPWKA